VTSRVAGKDAIKGNLNGTDRGDYVRFFNAGPAVPRGVEMKSYQEFPLPIETDLIRGQCLFVHRPTDRPDLMKSGEYPFGGHFHKRKRLWEIRFQFTLNREFEGDVFFGLEMDNFPNLSCLVDKAGMLVISSFKRLCPSLYFSKGDDPKGTVSGELSGDRSSSHCGCSIRS